MNIAQRWECITGKYQYYIEEVLSLRNSQPGYKVIFGILLIFLFPVLILEMLLVGLLGKDIGLFVPIKSVESPELREDEVPESLRDLIPLARKYGVGDDEVREELIKSASHKELAELEKKVADKAQEIANWLETFPEGKMSDTASFFLYLGSACDEIPLDRLTE